MTTRPTSRAEARPAALPDWPAILSAELTAEYLSISVTTLKRQAAEGRLPAPVHITRGRIGWRRSDLDHWIAALDRRARIAQGLEPWVP